MSPLFPRKKPLSREEYSEEFSEEATEPEAREREAPPWETDLNEEIKKEVGYPSESAEETEEEFSEPHMRKGYPGDYPEESEENFPEETTEAGELSEESEEAEPEYEGPPESGEPPPGFIPPFPPQNVKIPSGEDIQDIAKSVAEGIRAELEVKIRRLEEDISELKKLDIEMEKIVETLEKIESKYEALEEKTGILGSEMQAEISDIKTITNNTYQVMSTALPALIQKVSEISKRKK